MCKCLNLTSGDAMDLQSKRRLSRTFRVHVALPLRQGEWRSIFETRKFAGNSPRCVGNTANHIDEASLSFSRREASLFRHHSEVIRLRDLANAIGAQGGER